MISGKLPISQVPPTPSFDVKGKKTTSSSQTGSIGSKETGPHPAGISLAQKIYSTVISKSTVT